MVRRSLKQLAGCVGVLVVTGLLFAGLTRLLERGDNRQDTLDGDVRIQPFFEEENGFDVLVFGTSHAIYAIEPMKWWDNYGIASYNLAQHNMPIATTYWVMKNALDYTTPRLIRRCIPL